MPLQPNAAAKDREDYKLTGTSTDLSKKGNLEDIEKTDLNAKIECGDCGEVQFLESICCKCGKQMQNIPETRKDQAKIDTEECIVQMQGHKELSWRPFGTRGRNCSPSAEQQLAHKGKEHCDRAVTKEDQWFNVMRL